MKIETGNIFIHSYIDESTHEEVIILSVLPNRIRSYRIAHESENKQKLRDDILADCIRELWRNKDTDPFAVGDKEISPGDILKWAMNGVKMITVKERIQELNDFLIIAWEQYNGDWFEVPDELFAKYGLDPCDMDDRFYFGSALKMAIKQLEKFAEVENK